MSVALSADGRRIVSGSYDKSVRVWDAHSGECLRVLTGHSSPVMSVALSADGRRIVSGSYDKSVRVWDAHSGECLRVLTGHSNTVWSVALSADGRRIVSGSSDNSVRVWDAHSGECLRVLTGHSGWVRSVALSADGRRIVSGSDDNSVRVWDAHSGAALEVLEEDRKLLEREKAGSDIECARSELGTIRRQADGKELDIAALADGGYAVLERAAGETRWRLARAKGEYWRYVNHATDGPEGRILWSADVFGPVPEV
jgi:predicted NACHT family NTPase